MKSLQESLFDKDLTQKDINIDYKLLKDELFYLGRSRAIFFDKNQIKYHEGKQSIFISTPLNEYLDLELELSITNLVGFNLGGGCGFMLPTLKTTTPYSNMGGWRTSSTENHYTTKCLQEVAKKRNFNVEGKYGMIYATSSNMTEILDLYDDMFKVFASKDFKDELKKYVKMFEDKKAIPGLILDKLMKKLLFEA